MLKIIVPKKFLCTFPLYTGCICIAILFICIQVIAIITGIVRAVNIKSIKIYYYVTSTQLWRDAYGMSVAVILASAVILFINIWFIWGVKKGKSSVILCWVVIMSVWLVQISCLLIVMICIYSEDVNFLTWLLALIFGLICIGILTYCLLVGYAYWLELKSANNLQIIEM